MYCESKTLHNLLVNLQSIDRLNLHAGHIINQHLESVDICHMRMQQKQ